MIEPQVKKPTTLDYPVSMKFGAAPAWYVKIAGYPHNGVDFAMPDGVPILAVDNGKIFFADDVPDADGLGVIITHAWGSSLYWHLKNLSADFGQEVNRGDLIGHSGHSGWATGPHLHFGMRVNGLGEPGMRYWVDPERHFETPVGATLPASIGPKNYIVRPGDSLWKIAQKFYGSGRYWPKIYEANRDRIGNPNIIKIFQVLIIP